MGVINNMNYGYILIGAGFKAVVLCKLSQWFCSLEDLNRTETILSITPVVFPAN